MRKLPFFTICSLLLAGVALGQPPPKNQNNTDVTSNNTVGVGVATTNTSENTNTNVLAPVQDSSQVVGVSVSSANDGIGTSKNFLSLTNNPTTTTTISPDIANSNSNSNSNSNEDINVNDNTTVQVMEINSEGRAGLPIHYHPGALHVAPVEGQIAFWNGWDFGPRPLEGVVYRGDSENTLKKTGHLGAEGGRGFVTAVRPKGFFSTEFVERISGINLPDGFYDLLNEKMFKVDSGNIDVRDLPSVLNLGLETLNFIFGGVVNVDKPLVLTDGLEYATIKSMDAGAHVMVFSAGMNTAYVGAGVGFGSSRGFANPDAASGFTLGVSVNETGAKGYPVVKWIMYKFKPEYEHDYISKYTELDRETEFSIRTEILRKLAVKQAESARAQRSARQQQTAEQVKILQLQKELKEKEIELAIVTQSIDKNGRKGGSEKVVSLENSGVLKRNTMMTNPAQ